MFTNREFTNKPQGAQRGCRFIGIPSECPICRNGISPTLIEGVLSSDGLYVEMCFRCTHRDCERLFIARYTRSSNSESEPFQFLRSIPLHYLPPQVPDEVRTVSPTFVEVYGQALQAESHGLKQLVGMGLRKAAEFLVRDYLISSPPLKKNGKDKGQPMEAATIATLPFGNLIEHHVDDESIRNMALRAWWLGSDDAHYVRKYEGHDIEDLKGVIRTLMNWVERHVLTAKFTATITKHGSAPAPGGGGQTAPSPTANP